MKKRKMVAMLTSLGVAASLCITSLASVSTPSKADTATSSTAGRENGKKENLVESIGQNVELDDGMNIEIPMDLSFSIDPINLMEKGQIQSKEYTFKNNSNRDVRITFSEIYYTFTNEEDFKSLNSIEELNKYSTTKDIFLYLENVSPKVKMEVLYGEKPEEMDEDFDPNVEVESEETQEDTDGYRLMEEQKIVITDKMQNDAHSFVLSGNKKSLSNQITFRLNGAVTEFPEEPWKDSDVEISVIYDCVFEEEEEKVMESLSPIEQVPETRESTASGSGNAEETEGSSKEDSAQAGKDETEKESGTSDGSHTSGDKELSDSKPEDSGSKEEGNDTSQKEEGSDKGNGGNSSGSEGSGNSSSDKNDNSGNSGKDDSSGGSNTSGSKDSEGSGSSEKTDSGNHNSGKTEE